MRRVHAERILLAIALIVVGVFVAYGYRPDNTALQQIFEFLKVGLLPLVTLVIALCFIKADR